MCRKWGLIFLFYLFLQPLLHGQAGYVLNESFDQKPLSDIFLLLEKKFRVKFAYDEEVVTPVMISRHVQARELREALEQLFSGTDLVFQIPAPGQVLVRKEYLAPKETVSFLEINGRVTDNWSGASLPYAHVLYSESEGVATDENGRFRCRVPIKEGVPGSIQVQYIGYQSRKLALDLKNPPNDLNIRLSPKVEKLPGIVVKEKAPLISHQSGKDGSTLRISPLATMSFFVGGKDIFRGLQMLPGMNASDDLSADLSVRSGNGDENLVLLDGMTLYNVTHFFGIFSIVNPNIVDQVKIYKNAFPAEYGGRTSAIIDMRTQPMRQDGWQGVVDLNFLTSNAVMEVPIDKNMSLLLGLRTTNQDLGESSLFSKVDPNTGEVFLNLGANATSAKTVSTQQPNFHFYDANLKWTWQPSANTRFLASYFRGNDQFAYDFDRKIYPPFRRNNLYFQEEYVEKSALAKRRRQPILESAMESCV
ncbi:MAG: carboxypeptidase-like regulatory domain-containing protein [Haliscomenobacter sp.]|nr:carboxypeptidase-like regulatory domain-containing protein [Haliscomenobacter sp.]